MRKLFLCALAAIVYHFSQAQVAQAESESSVHTNMKTDREILLLNIQGVSASTLAFDNQYSGILGSAFLIEKWADGDVYKENGSFFRHLKVKFDVYKSKFFFNRNDTVYDISDIGIKQFEVNDNDPDHPMQFIFKKGFNIPGVSGDKFIQVLSSGKISLLKYLHKDIQEVNENSMLTKEKKFIDHVEYYVNAQNNPGQEIKLNKKTLQSLLGDKWTQITQYAKEKDLSFSEESGWASIINYYNGLQQ